MVIFTNNNDVSVSVQVHQYDYCSCRYIDWSEDYILTALRYELYSVEVAYGDDIIISSDDNSQLSRLIMDLHDCIDIDNIRAGNYNKHWRIDVDNI